MRDIGRIRHSLRIPRGDFGVPLRTVFAASLSPPFSKRGLSVQRKAVTSVHLSVNDRILLNKINFVKTVLGLLLPFRLAVKKLLLLHFRPAQAAIPPDQEKHRSQR